MIQLFNVKGTKPSDFIQKLTQALSGRELGKIVGFSISNDKVLITFSKLGKSEIVYKLVQEGEDFKCMYLSEKIAITHKALRKDIEMKIAKVLEASGAQVLES